jgi:hypothetical protein
MAPRALPTGELPTDPVRIEQLASAIVAEAAGETIGGAIGLVRDGLAAELRQWPGFVELPEQPADAAYFPAGLLEECAALFAWLGCLAGAGPERWMPDGEAEQSPRQRAALAALSRERERARLADALRSIAVHRLQLVGGEHVERAGRLLPALRAVADRATAARKGRASKLARARKAKALQLDAPLARRIAAAIRRRRAAGEPWHGMGAAVAAELGIPGRTARRHVRAAREAAE